MHKGDQGKSSSSFVPILSADSPRKIVMSLINDENNDWKTLFLLTCTTTKKNQGVKLTLLCSNKQTNSKTKK